MHRTNFAVSPFSQENKFFRNILSLLRPAEGYLLHTWVEETVVAKGESYFTIFYFFKVLGFPVVREDVVGTLGVEKFVKVSI